MQFYCSFSPMPASFTKVLVEIDPGAAMSWKSPGGSWWSSVSPGGSLWLLCCSRWLLVALLVAPVAPGGCCWPWWFLVAPWWLPGVAPWRFYGGFLVAFWWFPGGSLVTPCWLPGVGSSLLNEMPLPRAREQINEPISKNTFYFSARTILMLPPILKDFQYLKN